MIMCYFASFIVITRTSCLRFRIAGIGFLAYISSGSDANRTNLAEGFTIGDIRLTTLWQEKGKTRAVFAGKNGLRP